MIKRIIAVALVAAGAALAAAAVGAVMPAGAPHAEQNLSSSPHGDRALVIVLIPSI